MVLVHYLQQESLRPRYQQRQLAAFVTALEPMLAVVPGLNHQQDSTIYNNCVWLHNIGLEGGGAITRQNLMKTFVFIN